MSCLPKPVLRGHVKRHALKAIMGGLALAAVNGSLYYFLVKLPYETKYDAFMKTYDAEAHYNNLAKWGYLQSTANE